MHAHLLESSPHQTDFTACCTRVRIYDYDVIMS